MRKIILLPLMAALLLPVSAKSFRSVFSPDADTIPAVTCAALFRGQRETGKTGRLMTVVVCAEDLPALETALGGSVTPDAVILPTRGEAAAYCECHSECLFLLPVDNLTGLWQDGENETP